MERKRLHTGADGLAADAAAQLLRSKGPRLWVVLVLSFMVVFALVTAGFVRYDAQREREDTLMSLLEEGRMFAREMDAVWGFMDHAQYTINNSSAGYQFKGLHCAIVGKSVGTIFSKDNDYTIRYTNFNPRNSLDNPDEFEAEALTAFANDPTVTEYYGIADYQGEEKFRYIRALEVDESCLECHGDPAGELDITGHVREGWTLDSVGGAISIVIPTDQAIANERSSIVRDAVAFFMLMLVAGAAVMAIITFSVMQPLGRMKRAFADMQDGQLGVHVGSAGSVREIADLTDQFNAMSNELDEMYRTIEQQVKDRTLDLSRANAILERQRDDLARLNEQLAKETQFKTDLLSMVNHELRTPLTSIITLAQISEELSEEGTSERMAWVEVENNSQVLLSMINDMLDIARSDAGMVTATREVMDLGDILASVRQSMVPIAMKYQVDFSTVIGSNVPLVLGDFEKTVRILVNLVSNAVKFTPDGGFVRLEIELDAQGESVLCRVTDNGIGIASADQDRIFDRFVQVDSTSTRKYPGSGLGLAIVKEYAELQGFAVQLESELGKGSVFTLVIPGDYVVGEGNGL